MSTTQTRRRVRRGVTLVVSLIFLVTFAAFAGALVSISSANVQNAHNLHLVNGARASAESGLEVMHHWLARVTVPHTTGPQEILSTVASHLAKDLSANGIRNIVSTYDGSTITVDRVVLRSHTDQSFEAVVRQTGDYVLQVDVTGYYGQIERTIRANFNLDPERHPIFGYGLASKGPIQLRGNPTFIGVNVLDEADVYIQSDRSALALDIFGNANLDGDVSIGNGAASVHLVGNAQIGGDYGQAAIDNHIFIGADPVDFPVPDTGHFRQYATGPVIDADTDTSLKMTLTNAVIAADANPRFKGNVLIEGVLFVESPNVVEFRANVDIQGLIVAHGDVNDPGDNRMTFYGNFASGPFPSDARYDTMRHEVGSSVLAPGFKLRLKGNLQSLAGVMAISGADFLGNVDAVAEGTIINYSDDLTVARGNPTLKFDLAGLDGNPAGFDGDRVPTYDPSSYQEIIL